MRRGKPLDKEWPLQFVQFDYDNQIIEMYDEKTQKPETWNGFHIGNLEQCAVDGTPWCVLYKELVRQIPREEFTKALLLGHPLALKLRGYFCEVMDEENNVAQ